MIPKDCYLACTCFQILVSLQSVPKKGVSMCMNLEICCERTIRCPANWLTKGRLRMLNAPGEHSSMMCILRVKGRFSGCRASATKGESTNRRLKVSKPPKEALFLPVLGRIRNTFMSSGLAKKFALGRSMAKSRFYDSLIPITWLVWCLRSGTRRSRKVRINTSCKLQILSISSLHTLKPTPV